MASPASEHPPEAAHRENPGKTLRVGIIGCGGISDMHFRTLKEMPDVEVVAAVDPFTDRLRKVQEKYAVAEVFQDWKDMLRSVPLDGVDVCAPNAVHAAAVIDALNAGCHAITEKPMARTPAECQAMIDAAKKNERKLAIAFQYRFHPYTRFLAQARDEGDLGKIMFAKCLGLRRRGIPNWGVFGQKALQGGGPLIDLGVHIIEMAHYVMGSPQPRAASGNIWTYFGNKPSAICYAWPGWDHATYTVEDLAIGQIRFDNGAILQVEASFVAHIEKDVWNFSLMGERGGCTWEPPTVFTDRAGHMINYSPAHTADGSFAALFQMKLRNWVDACLHDRPLEAPGEAGMAVQKMIDGIYRSAAEGREVAID
mgnify:CR=1 FL=1